MKLYSDISWVSHYPYFGWAYAVTSDNDKYVQFKSGTFTAEIVLKKGWLEYYPIELALKSWPNQIKEIHTDHLPSVPPNMKGVLVNKQNPWHMLCHCKAQKAISDKSLQYQSNINKYLLVEIIGKSLE